MAFAANRADSSTIFRVNNYLQNDVKFFPVCHGKMYVIKSQSAQVLSHLLFIYHFIAFISALPTWSKANKSGEM